MLRKKISKADKRLEKEKKNQYRQLKPYIWCQLISSNSLIWNKEWYTIHHTFFLSYSFYRNRMIFKHILVRKIKKLVLMCTLVINMTQLLTHIVAHSTMPSSRPKTNNITRFICRAVLGMGEEGGGEHITV